MKGRLEDWRLLTGQGRFISDWNFPNQAYAAFLRSDRAHAEIVSVDAGSALEAPGVLAVLTGRDVAEAGYKSIPTNLGVVDRFGEPLKKPPRPVLAQVKVRHVGECVACVVAESAQLAQDAAELIAVEYRELPAVTAAEKALAPGAAQLHAELPGNLSFDWVAGDEAATEAAFRTADRVVKLALDNPRMVGNPMEPRACSGTYDAATQKYALYACTQGTAGMRGQLVYTMGVPDDKIDVIAEDVGGGVGARVKLAVTNKAPGAAYRGAGRPVMSYMIERLVDQAAVELGIDPAELRRRNLVTKDKFPYKAANGNTYDCGDFEGVLGDAVAASDWAGFPARRAQSAARGRLRGRGMAAYIEASGGGFAPSDQVELRFDAGGAITMYAVSHSHGQGHETSYAQIVSSVLGVPMEKFRLRNGDPAVRLVGNATGGSRSLLGVGSVMQLAAKQVVEKGLALASKELEAAAADIEFREGSYRIKGTDRAVALLALAHKYAGTPNALDVKTEGKFGVTFPNGCHVAEVEIEPETGIAEIVRFTAVDDAGNIINHQIVEGQMQGGITQGAGQVFGEHAVYDPDTGQLLTGSFMDYPMPRAGLVSGLAIHEHPVPTATNPLGAKGVGEAGVSGSLPALMNAASDALRQASVTRFDMPATPDRLWRAIRSAKAGGRS